MATNISQSSQPSKRENKLARSLVHPEKQVRDQTFSALLEYIRGVKQLSDLEMLKLWKALYYCMWLSDKREVQEELANSFASIIGDFRNNKLRLQYIQMFFRILLREWSLLDLHRMNKFYYLVRVIIRKALQTSFEQLPKTDFAESLNELLYAEVLTQRPNGVRFHVSDLYLSELLVATGGKCNTEFYILSIEPFFKFLTVGDENIVMDRVAKAIFQSYLENHAKEVQDDDNKNNIFKKVDTRFIQGKLFDVASAEETGGRYRSRLYALHKTFSRTTGLDFVDTQSLTTVSTATAAVEASASNDNNEKADKKDKKKKRSAEVMEAAPVVAAVEEQEDGKKKKKKKTSA